MADTFEPRDSSREKQSFPDLHELILSRELSERDETELAATLIPLPPVDRISDGEKEVVAGIEALYRSDLKADGIVHTIAGIKAWCAGEPMGRIEFIERTLADLFSKHRDGATLNLPLLQLLGELQQERCLVFVDKALVDALQLYGTLSPEVQRQLHELNTQNNPQGSLVVHKILDFIKEYMRTAQDPLFLGYTLDRVNKAKKQGGFFDDVKTYAHKESPYVTNYLIQKHFNEIVEFAEPNAHNKPGTIWGMPGGSSDETIYTFEHLAEVYKHRLDLGINEGYPIKNPVLPIAPGYFGYYEQDRLQKVFRQSESDSAMTAERLGRAVDQNDPRDNGIYDALNAPLDLGPGEHHSSRQLEKLRTLWAFKARLKENGRRFYFDLTRINPQALHPVVFGWLVTENQRFLDAREGKANRSTALTSAEFSDVLFPRRGLEHEGALYRYNNLAKLHMRKKIEDDFGVKLESLNLWTQRHFLTFLEQRTVEDVQALQEFTKQFGVEGVQTFLAMEFGGEYGQQILDIARVLPSDDAKRLFHQFSQLVGLAEQHAEEIAADLRGRFPDVAVDGAAVFESLIARARDLLRTIPTAEPKRASRAAAQTLGAIEKESAEQSVLRAQFTAVVELLSAKDVDLRGYEAAQRLLFEAAKDDRSRAVFLHSLQAFGRLKPIPEIHWRVDRDMGDYNRRVGLDLTEFLRAWRSGQPRTLLEVGPGAGMAKQQRADAFGKDIRDYGLSDAVYFPVAPIVGKLIDYAKLEAAIGGALNETDRALLAEFLAKTLVIAPGQTAQDRFDYDAEALERLGEDVNALKELLPEAAKRLGPDAVVPSTISSRDADGNVVYPYKQEAAKQSPAFRQALELLTKDFERYWDHAAHDRDLYEVMETYPANVMIGDMRGIERLADEQLDFEVGVRSTVYLRGKDWTDFLATLNAKLTAEGIAIDDSVRDSDGWYYRIAELLRVEQTLAASGQYPTMLVVLGPGFPGEDHRQDTVPLAVIISKGPLSQEDLEPYLLPGSSLRPLRELAADHAYLKTLDATGLTASLAEKAREFDSKGT